MAVIAPPRLPTGTCFIASGLSPAFSATRTAARSVNDLGLLMLKVFPSRSLSVLMFDDGNTIR